MNIYRTFAGAALVGVLILTACSTVENALPTIRSEPVDESNSGPQAGEIDDSVSIDRITLPALARLDPFLLAAVRSAAEDARNAGVTVRVTSGWRSAGFQQRLLDDAVAKYGSSDIAAKWVQPPSLSKHVSGDAVDIGPTDAANWMTRHGSDYGLCQTYANEMWHFELATTPGGECPPLLPDASAGRGDR
ncbi:M15 family metallopeptidase [Rhodococcus sp. 27YEA15]|uniref:M15 family metallopeptidase n=1 Tax=Rhodococcus sp. 27YEA15 TaxID=3156259 RepID=UPI003C7C8567